jgi:hypothetical protein
MPSWSGIFHSNTVRRNNRLGGGGGGGVILVLATSVPFSMERWK